MKKPIERAPNHSELERYPYPFVLNFPTGSKGPLNSAHMMLHHLY